VGIRYLWLQVNPLHTNDLAPNHKDNTYCFLHEGNQELLRYYLEQKILKKIELRVRDRTRI